MDARDLDDLRWYWDQAEGDMGIKSNYGSMVACLELGLSHIGGKVCTDVPERCLEAACRERRVRRILARMPPQPRTVLRHYFSAHPWKSTAWGEYAPLAPHTLAFKDVNSCDVSMLLAWYTSMAKLDPAVYVLVDLSVKEAKALLESAFASWEEARSGRI